jgi:Fibronectin type III domain
MGAPAFFVCRLQNIFRFPKQQTALKIFVVSLSVLTCSTLMGCGSGGDGDGAGAPDVAGSGSSAVPSGSAFASLAWDPVPNVIGYIIHYGTTTPGSPQSCAYAQSMFSSSPSVTVTGLANNTTYYFAVSAYNGLESACSAEVTTVTGTA